MTAPDDAALQALLLLELGDDGTVLAQMTTIWDMYEPYSAYYAADPRLNLRYLMSKRKGADVLIGKFRADFSFSEKDRRLELKEIIANLLTIRNNTTAEIDEVMFIVNNAPSDSVSVGQLDAIAPDERSTYFDPNNLRYSGDPTQTVVYGTER